jgi:hypothetical protein
MPSTVRSLAAAALLGGAVLSPAVLAATSVPLAAPASAPVMIAGLWCGAGPLRNYVLEVAQQVQQVEAKLIRRNRVHLVTGHMEGPVLKADPQRDHTMDLRAEGNELRIVSASGLLALTRGLFFTRAVGGSCSH